MPILQLAGGDHRIAGGDGLGQVVHADAQRLQSGRIGQHLILRLAAAQYLDIGRARRRGDQRAQGQVGVAAQADRIAARRTQRQAQHRKHSRVHPLDGEADPRRQVGRGRRQRRLGLQRCGDHIVAPGEVQRDVGRSAAGGRADLLHARHAAQSLFQGPCDLGDRLVGGLVAGVDADHHAREVDAREQADRQMQRRAQPRRRQQQKGQDQRAGVL